MEVDEQFRTYTMSESFGSFVNVPKDPESKNKRDHMSNAYFLTIDERVFSQCSIERFKVELVNQKRNLKKKQD